jgi:hypothetical protein
MIEYDEGRLHRRQYDESMEYENDEQDEDMELWRGRW